MLALCCSLMAQAQNEAITTVLQTGDEVKVYNGIDGLKKAIADAAESGSIITLSDGTFNNPGEIKKSVTIYGNGWEEDAEQGIKPSIISGELNFLSGSNEVSLKGIRLEGIKTGTINVRQTDGMIISKCQFGNFGVGENNKNVSIRQCYFSTVVGSAYVNLDVQNCISTGRMTYSNIDALLSFDHCVLSYRSRGGYNYYNHFKAIYKNSIIMQSRDGWGCGISEGSTVQNCILDLNSVPNCIATGNWYTVDLNELFENGSNLDYSPTSTYVLKSPNTYVGTDGKEVGIHGGNYPWDKKLPTPVVKNLKLNISGKKLNVNFDAEVR